MDSSFPSDSTYMKCIVNIPDIVIEYLLRTRCSRFSKGFMKEVRNKILDFEEPEIL